MRTRLTTQQVDYLNIALMALSAASAFAWPFQTFLFAYAVFGPLHYLTEISWLRDRGFFSKRRGDGLLLAAAAAAIAAVDAGLVPGVQKSAVVLLTFVAFAAALVFVTTSNPFARAALIAAAFGAGRFVQDAPAFVSLFGIFLPTLVHVFLFTGCFILLGALRGRSASGFASLAAFLVCGAACFLWTPDRSGAGVSDYVRGAYGTMRPDGAFDGGFVGLNFHFVTVFGMHDFGRPGEPQADFVRGVNSYLYSNPAALSVMSFTAFAYCYHYLNWFSKTSVVRWHEAPRRRLALVAAGWTASLALYAYDYAVGLKWLLLLSMAHVFLEFPLNHATFGAIGREIGDVVAGRTSAAAAVRSSKR